ncbi:MAG: ATP-binding protein, partial [Myxococcota bacterium]
ALLYPRLTELRKMLRSLLGAIDPNATPERLSESIVKTLGLSREIEKRLSAVIAEQSVTEYIATATLDQLSDTVRAAAVVPRGKIELTVNRIARSAASALGKAVAVVVSGDAIVDGEIERRLQPVLLHLVRNAVDHGIESPRERESLGKQRTGLIDIRIETRGDRVQIEVRDDGRGIDFEEVRRRLEESDPEAATMGEEDLKRSLFRHGFSTRSEVTSLSGRGVGLDVVYDSIVSGGGDVRVESVPGEGTRFLMALPASTRVDTVLPLSCGTIRAALPSVVVRYAGRLSELIQTPNGLRAQLSGFADEERVPVMSLSALLGHGREVQLGDIVIGVETARGALAVAVDAYETPRALVTQPVSDLLSTSPLVQAVAPMPEGEVLLLLDVSALYEHATQNRQLEGGESDRARLRHVLVVEDATVARGLLVGMLSSFGLRVSEAMDGALGLDQALADPPDLVLTDLEMPVMDGFEMVESLRSNERTKNIPIVVLSTRDDPQTLEWAKEQRIREFLPKRRFEEKKLRKLIREIFGS